MPARRARFVAGDVLGGRYRIEALLGRGGMGEVYRAEDLKIGATVALKFLPTSLVENPAMLARFHAEVRLARQVTHANVCRVHDIGEVDGQPFLTMEFVDGENLASLLRRIRRLPEDKAVEIARQMCAGLAAAHDRGVLHRDLKPENVMIDGEGRVRLMDFGLAAVRGEISAGDLRSGTPAYMAPEQLDGREVTTRSDLYGLGLVLHEMFTGRQVFDAPTLADLRRQRASFTPERASLSTVEIDTAVEQVIQRCLETAPERRPASAMAVALALPGGDPLRAALAAGELPSPEMVAAAGADAGMPRMRALAAFGLFTAGLIATLGILQQRTVVGVAPVSLTPEALAERAREVLRRTGDEVRGADQAYGFRTNREALDWLRSRGSGEDPWRILAAHRIGATAFWYRQAPREMTPVNLFGTVSLDDPDPGRVSGSGLASLDEDGRLLQMLRVPPQVPDTAAPGPAEADWDPLFEAAGIDPARLEPVEPEWLPPVFADSRHAWRGSWPEAPEIPVRIEAASFRGKPVWFDVVRPWSRPARMQPYERSRWERLAQNLNVALVIAALAGATFLARRSLRSGRADARGAMRISVAVFVLVMVRWACSAHHQTDAQEEWDLFLQGTAFALLLAGICCVLYLGLEPIVRKRWPDTLIGWSRLVAGRFRDPHVARDVLLGLAAAAAMFLVVWAVERGAEALGGARRAPTLVDFSGTLGIRSFVGRLALTSVNVLISPMLILLLLAVLKWMLRSSAAAVAVTLLLIAPIVGSNLAAEGSPWVGFVVGIVIIGTYLLVLVRWGLLSLMALTLFTEVVSVLPATLDPSHWFFGYSAAGAVLLLAVGVAAFRWASAPGIAFPFAGQTRSTSSPAGS